MRKFTLFLMSLFLTVGAMAQSYLVGNKVTDVQTGYYVVVGTFNPGNGTSTQTGPVYYITGQEKKYRLDVDKTIVAGESLSNGKYIWYVENNGTTITLKNVQNDVYFVKDGARNENFKGTETANLTLEKISQNATESKFFLHLASDPEIGYIHCNTPGGDPCLSYWPSHDTTQSTSVRFEFYEVQVDLSAPAIIDDYYEANTTFDTYSGAISNIINGDRGDKWWSNGAQDVDKTITVVLNKVHQVGDIKWYFHDGDKPQGAAIERRAVADGEWINVADFTIGDIENNIFTCSAEGADVKELRLRITATHSNWLQVAEVELYEFIEDETDSVREAFNAAYAAAGEVITASGYTAKEAEDLPLQTTDSNAAYYIWTNAQESSEGPISQLVDGDKGNKNFFHTTWNNPPAGPHYIEVDLGENCNLSEFIIRYSTRINNDGTLADFPDAIEIVGSNEKNGTYTRLATFNQGLPQGQGQYWESAVVENNGYRYLRFNVTAEKTFWHMAEFDITIPASVSINKEYEDLVDEIAALKEAYDNVSGNANYGYNEYVEATNALTTALTYTPHILNVTDAGWATLFLGFNATIPEFKGEDAGAYIVKGVKKGNWLDLVKVEDVLPANTGIIVKADKGNYKFYYATAATAVENNLLAGSVEATTVEGEAYVLGYAKGTTDVVFAKAELTDGKFLNNANKAYLPATALASGAAAPYYSFRFQDGTTGVEDVEVESASNVIFDLTGRKVNAVERGIYIINGKKVLVK